MLEQLAWFILASIALTIGMGLLFGTALFGAFKVNYKDKKKEVLIVASIFPIYFLATILTVYSMRWIMLVAFGSVWIATFMVDLTSFFGKLVPAWLVQRGTKSDDDKLMSKGEIVGVILMFVAVIVAFGWR